MLFVLDLDESDKDQINCRNNRTVSVTRMATNKQGDQETPDQVQSENANVEASSQVEEIDVALAGESDRCVFKFHARSLFCTLI